MQRNPLPNKGFCGCQWCLYLAHKISFIFLWNASICLSESLPFPLIIFVKNLHAISTSAFISFDSSMRKWMFTLEQFLFRFLSSVIVQTGAFLSTTFFCFHSFTPVNYQLLYRIVPSPSKSRTGESLLPPSSATFFQVFLSSKLAEIMGSASGKNPTLWRHISTQSRARSSQRPTWGC